MATGWAQDGAAQEQTDGTIKDAVAKAPSQIPTGAGLNHCTECAEPIPQTRRKAI